MTNTKLPTFRYKIAPEETYASVYAELLRLAEENFKIKQLYGDKMEYPHNKVYEWNCVHIHTACTKLAIMRL